ncbi:MAG: BrnA antitoxin family protein [Burkholderiaceae bacterium]
MHLRRADITAGKLVPRKRNATRGVLPNEKRVNILLDGAAIEHFKAKAGDRGYQTLINEALPSSEATFRRCMASETAWTWPWGKGLVGWSACHSRLRFAVVRKW